MWHNILKGRFMYELIQPWGLVRCDGDGSIEQARIVVMVGNMALKNFVVLLISSFSIASSAQLWFVVSICFPKRIPVIRLCFTLIYGQGFCLT